MKASSHIVDTVLTQPYRLDRSSTKRTVDCSLRHPTLTSRGATSDDQPARPQAQTLHPEDPEPTRSTTLQFILLSHVPDGRWTTKEAGCTYPGVGSSSHWSPHCRLPVRPGPLAAQQAVTVTGRVTNDAGAPLSLASVYIEALGLGTQTAEDGRYQITVPAARVTGQQVSLGVRAIGFRNTSALITLTGGALTKDFTLTANPLRLGEVVVTGSGTSTTVEKLGNTINSVKSEDVQKSNEPNIVNALAAKAPGVEVTSQAGDPGAGSSIIIRGLKTIQGDGQPLFVIDGQPIDNSTLSDRRLPDAVDRVHQPRRRHQP